MQKIVSKYALAAHLAIMAVAPLFLLPFLAERSVAIVELWLSLFGVIWLLMEPSRHRGEMPHDARERVAWSMIVDPLFWFSLVVVVYVGIRALNTGIALAYDAELMQWSIHPPFMPMLPGSTEGVGFLPFTVVLALAIIVQGARHALGRSARAAFLLVLSTVSACAAIVLAVAVSYGHAGALALVKTTIFSASYYGTAFGILFLTALVAEFNTIDHQWVKAEPVAALALVGNAIGLTLFAPPLTVAVFLVAFLLLAIISFVITRTVMERSASLRCALAVMMSLGATVLYALSTADMPTMAAKVAAFQTFEFFPEDFFPLRKALSGISLSTWKANPWQGTGLGSFPLDIRFAATAEDWLIVAPMQQTALCGWWQLLVERGVVGAMMFAVVLGFMAWTYFSRLVGLIMHPSTSFRFMPEHLLGPFAILSLVALAFFDCSFLRPEVLLPLGALMALSGGAFPARKVSEHGD